MRAGGEGKGKVLARELSTHPRMENSRAERQGRINQPLELEDEEGERGYILGYTLTPEDL